MTGSLSGQKVRVNFTSRPIVVKVRVSREPVRVTRHDGPT